MASASWRSHLVLLPWTAFMARAWPSAKGMWASRQASASQYQQCMHSQPTTTASRKGGDRFEEGFGGGGEVAAEAGLSVAVEDDEEEGPGVQVHAGVESDVGGRLEAAHERPPVGGGAKGGDKTPPPSSQARAFMSIHPLQPTGAACRPRAAYNLPRGPGG